MSYSNTITESQTFTATHAKHIASKVATDLKRIQRFYHEPSDSRIEDFELELIELLKHGYLDTVTYGFKKNGSWIEPTIQYTSKDLQGMSASDDDPGRIRPNADTSNAQFYSFLSYSRKWLTISENERERFEKLLPFRRPNAATPSINGYLSNDKVYSSGGRSLERSIVKSY